ncbi:RHE_PE00001 family protein [Rhodoblastus sp.]|uniref:RHE_PE00001 family protein n=1 Tax=Rhodoblastus sp. TaxID=1962975 RepID=UPI003F9490BA
MTYSDRRAVSLDRLQAPFEVASDVLARLDERLRSSAVAQAFVLRAHFHDACGAMWRAGELVSLEDLVLHDFGMDVRAPSHELVRAHEVLLTRRRIADHEPGWALSKRGLATLRGGLASNTSPPRSFAQNPGSDGENEKEEFEYEDAADAPSFATEFEEIDALLARTSAAAQDCRIGPFSRDASGLVYDEDCDEEARLSQWLEGLKENEDLPPLMSAAFAFDAWEEIAPLQRRAWLGALLAAALLRARDKARHHLPALHAGFRHAQYRRARRQDLSTRLIGFAQAIEATAKREMKEIDRLTLARELLLRKCVGRRGNSKLSQLVELCLNSPIVSAPLVAKKLKVSQQAASTMIDALSLNLRELTGRGRYRAWAVL